MKHDLEELVNEVFEKATAPERVRLRKNHVDAQHKYSLWTRYRMTTEDYIVLLVEQEFKCAICLRTIEEARLGKGAKNARFSVDHDHRTNQVRGLLCNSCNQILGYADDDPEIFARCIAYLRKYNGRDT